MTFVTVTKFSRTLVALLIHCCSARPCPVQQAFPSPIKVVYAFYRDKYKPTVHDQWDRRIAGLTADISAVFSRFTFEPVGVASPLPASLHLGPNSSHG